MSGALLSMLAVLWFAAAVVWFTVELMRHQRLLARRPVAGSRSLCRYLVRLDSQLGYKW